MSADEISEAQSPLAGWDRPSRTFAANGADPPPRWSDFSDPLDAIRRALATSRARTPSRFNKAERRALSVLGLGEDADRHALRQRYSALVRRYHPDKNGGDRRTRAGSREVIDAYQLLRKVAGFRLVAVGRAEREIGAVGPASSTTRATTGCASSRAR